MRHALISVLCLGLTTCSSNGEDGPAAGEIGAACAIDAQCGSAFCGPGAVCRNATCNDASLGPDEVGVDCGGACPGCLGAPCITAAGCATGYCAAGICAVSSCTDGLKNGFEWGLDCGGGECGLCPNDQTCGHDQHCLGGACVGGLCSGASCSDNVTSANETDTDCGGTCPPCADGKTCAAGSDCQSGLCQGGKCAPAPPGCVDGMKSGTESDVDCGGSCKACGVGGICFAHNDCSSGHCSAGTCTAAATCSNAQKDGTETDIDCGGPSCTPCLQGKQCKWHGDCASATCVSGACKEASCSDGVVNQQESDVDCGGTCGPCAAGKKCVTNTDCVTGACSGGLCGSCGNGIQDPGEDGIDCGGGCATPCLAVLDVDAEGAAGQYVSLAVDDAGGVHIASITDYLTGGAFCCGLRYAKLSGGQWWYETLTTDVMKSEVAIAVSPTGAPAVVYRDRTGVLRARVLSAQVLWSDVVVDADGAGTVSVARSNDVVHVAYSRLTGGTETPTYASFSGAVFTPTAVDSWPSQTVQGISITLQNGLQPHVSWTAAPGQSAGAELRYSAMINGVWTASPIAPVDSSDATTAIAVAPTGVTVAHGGFSGARIYRRIGASEWVQTIVDTSPVGWVSLATPAGNAMSYHRLAPAGLHLAFEDLTGWSSSTVAIGDQAGLWNSMAVDANGGVYVAWYKGAPNGGLQLGTGL